MEDTTVDILVDLDHCSHLLLTKALSTPSRRLLFLSVTSGIEMECVLDKDKLGLFKKAEWIQCPLHVDVLSFFLGYMTAPTNRSMVKEWIQHQPEWVRIGNFLSKLSQEGEKELTIFSNNRVFHEKKKMLNALEYDRINLQCNRRRRRKKEDSEDSEDSEEEEEEEEEDSSTEEEEYA